MRNKRSDPTPASETSVHTLAGVLSRLNAGGRGEPELEHRLDRAFAKHADKLRAFCAKELRKFSAAQVEDVTQDVLLEAWNKLPAYRPENPFRSFLWAIAAYKCANLRRRKADTLSEDGFLEATSSERSILSHLADEERNRLVEEASRGVLDASEQELVHLRWVLDYPLEDIASILGLESANAARVGLQRCKRRMEKEIPRLLAERGLGDSFLRPSTDPGPSTS